MERGGEGKGRVSLRGQDAVEMVGTASGKLKEQRNTLSVSMPTVPEVDCLDADVGVDAYVDVDVSIGLMNTIPSSTSRSDCLLGLHLCFTKPFSLTRRSSHDRAITTCISLPSPFAFLPSACSLYVTGKYIRRVTLDERLL